MGIPLIARAIFFTLLMPGVVTLLVPYSIFRGSASDPLPGFSLLEIPGWALGVLGFGVLLYCIWGFAVYGRGTLAPFSPTRVLVIRGPYRRTRNPMYLAVLSILLAETFLCRSLDLAIYLAFVFICFHLFVVLYEEPHLSRQFGDEYRRYRQAVPRWGMASRPFQSGGHEPGQDVRV